MKSKKTESSLKKLIMEDEAKKSAEVVGTAATIGATAGMGIAGLFGIGLLVPAVIGAGITCLVGASITVIKDDE